MEGLDTLNSLPNCTVMARINKARKEIVNPRQPSRDSRKSFTTKTYEEYDENKRQ